MAKVEPFCLKLAVIKKTVRPNFRMYSNEERFWQKTDKQGEDDCWMWKGSRHGKNYMPMLHIDSPWSACSLMSAQRFSYQLHHKTEVPNGWYVANNCDENDCVNPKHLWLVNRYTLKKLRKENELRKKNEHYQESMVENDQADERG